MPKKKNQKIKPTPKTDSERETRVLLEEVRADFKLIAEQYGSIAKKLEEHGQKLNRHDTEFLKIQARFDKLEQQFGAILTNHEHRLKAVEQKLEVT